MNRSPVATASTATTHLPYFDGFPYLVTRVVGAMRHIMLLPDDLSAADLVEIVHRQARANRLETCLALSAVAALYMATDGTEQWTDAIPRGGIILTDRLRPSYAFPDTTVFADRRRRLEEFAESTRPRSGYVLGDLTKGGRKPKREESVLLAGRHSNGVPRGLARCTGCNEWRGRCFDPAPRFAGRVMDVHCRCANDNHCAACGALLYERKLNANYYDETDGQIWHVPGFLGFDHMCHA